MTKKDTLPLGFQEENASLLPSRKGLTAAELSLRERLLRPNADGLVRISRKNLGRLPVLRGSDEAFEAITEEDIRKAVESDPDAVPLDLDWSNAVVVVPGPKTAISIRLDSDVLAFFKSMGKGYQTRMGQVLRSYMLHQQKRQR